MAYSKIALSLPVDLLAWVDEAAARQQVSRSHFIRAAREAQRIKEEQAQIVAESNPVTAT
jgi:metal-responsive CopG/Arc/MetJ family transcriptional regulator